MPDLLRRLLQIAGGFERVGGGEYGFGEPFETEPLVAGVGVFIVLLVEAMVSRRKAEANPWGVGATTLSGKTVDKTFNAGVKVDTATVDRRDMTYLYHDGSDYVFMDGDTYDQISIGEATIGDGARFLLENMTVQVSLNEGQPLFVELPVTVELTVTHTDPGLQGDRSTGGTKPATVETGAEIQVPLFINTGDKLKVDSRDGSYLGRVNS